MTTEERLPARATIPAEVLRALSHKKMVDLGIDLYIKMVDQATKENQPERLERAEQQIARIVHTNAGTAMKVLTGAFSEDKAAHVLMNLAALEAGDPYGAHRAWYDRRDMAAILKYPEVYISELTRKGHFDIIMYGNNPTPRGVKRWATAQSVQQYKALRDEGVTPAEILRRTRGKAT